MVTDSTTTKYCTFCEKDHPLTREYWLFKTTANGTPTYRCRKRDLDTYHWWCEANKERRDKRLAEWYQENKAAKTAKRRKYYKTNLNFRVAAVLRARLVDALNNDTKAGSAVRDLGCSIQEFKQHIESLWLPGMTWDNWSKDGWHIDHIEPISKFDLSDPEQLKKACHYTNMQPLWAKDNLSKGNRTVSSD